MTHAPMAATPNSLTRVTAVHRPLHIS